MIKTTLVSAEFSAAHFYKQKTWSDTENNAHFGKCFSKYGHGHNYFLEVGFQNTDSPLSELKSKVQELVMTLDHQHLNFTIPEFSNMIPTTENIAIYLFKRLHELCPTETLSPIRLYETKDLWVEIKP